MLHDHARGIGEALHALQRRIRIGDVVVRERLAVQLLRRADARLRRLALGIEGGALMGVLSVAHLRALVKLQVDGARKVTPRIALVEAAEVVGDGAVVGGGMLEDLGGQVTAGGIRHRTLIRRHLVHDQGIVRAVHHDGDMGVVLRGGAQHGRPADIDVLDGGRDVARWIRHGLLERIQVHHQQIDGGDAVLVHHRVILTPAPHQSAVDLRMQGLHAPVHDFGEARMLRHLFDSDAGIREQAGGAAGREYLYPSGGQPFREFNDATLVRHADQRALDH
jgi:hypothetical protein